MASVDRRIGRRLARSRPVRAAVQAVADQVLAAAKARAEQHRRDGTLARSLRVRPGRTDARVESTDPDILAKEYGHTDKATGRHVPGLHVLGGAAADTAAKATGRR